MGSRNHMPRHFVDIHRLRGGPEPSLNRGILGPAPVNPMVDEELEVHHIENRRIAAENQHMVHENMNLASEVGSAIGEVPRLDEQIVKLRADNYVKSSSSSSYPVYPAHRKLWAGSGEGSAAATHTRKGEHGQKRSPPAPDDNYVKYRDLIERELKLEDDLRTTEPLREEVLDFKAEILKVNIVKHYLTEIQGLAEKIARLRSENEELNTLRADVCAVREELAEARRELENEKKANQELVEQKGVIEKNLTSMAHEMEELRAELMSMNMRGHELGGGSSDVMPNLTYPVLMIGAVRELLMIGAVRELLMIGSSYAMPLQQHPGH